MTNTRRLANTKVTRQLQLTSCWLLLFKIQNYLILNILDFVEFQMAKRLFLYFFILVPVWCRLADDIDTVRRSQEPPTISQLNERCFHQPQEECPSPKSTCRCHQLTKYRRAAVCCDVNDFQLREGLACSNITADGRIEALHIRNATLKVLNVSDSHWRRLRFMTITDGQIDSVEGEFAKLTPVSCLNLSSNNINKFEDRSLVNLIHLNFLDLSHNNLSDIPRYKKDGNITVDIINNKPMLCTSVFGALKNTEIHFENENDTYCASSKNYNWFNSTERVPVSQMINIHKLQQSCVQNCTCTMKRLEMVVGQTPTIAAGLTCFQQEFLSLPTPLPSNTMSLNISNNNITSLKELSHPSYEYLNELYADNNQISSIQPLEGTKFMSNFVVLSLRNNRIKSLETYLLSAIKFDRNNNPRNVNFGLNKLHCDCNTAKGLTVWLITKQTHLPDSDEILCDNMDLKVVDLKPSKLCQTQQDWSDYISYIITAEVLLLVSLIAKVFYDYWIFKTAGYLPWPASKMPKLPCDWLCE